MGRSVSVHPHAVTTVYLSLVDLFSEDWASEPLAHEYFDDLLWDLREVVKSRYPSFEHQDCWLGREDRAILENDHGYVVVAEYCGLVSVSLVPDEHVRNEFVELSRHWCESIAQNFRKTLHKAYDGAALDKLGSASNGEAFFTKATA